MGNSFIVLVQCSTNLRIAPVIITHLIKLTPPKYLRGLVFLACAKIFYAKIALSQVSCALS